MPTLIKSPPRIGSPRPLARWKTPKSLRMIWFWSSPNPSKSWSRQSARPSHSSSVTRRKSSPQKQKGPVRSHWAPYEPNQLNFDLRQGVAQIDVNQAGVRVLWIVTGNLWAAGNAPGAANQIGVLRDDLQLPVVRAGPQRGNNPNCAFLDGPVR